MGVFVKRIKVFPLGCTLAIGDIPRRPVSTVVCPFPFECMLARGGIFDLCKRGILSSTENESVFITYSRPSYAFSLHLFGHCVSFCGDSM